MNGAYPAYYTVRFLIMIVSLPFLQIFIYTYPCLDLHGNPLGWAKAKDSDAAVNVAEMRI